MEYKETFPPESGEIKNRIVNYWTQRSHAFSELREKEQVSETGQAWLAEIVQNLPSGKKLKILDIGCGTGMFALMLSQLGHDTTGIDLTEHMVLHARELAAKQHSSAKFFCMDAESPAFADNTFDILLTRNLTWTLPHAEQAYAQWFRILKRGGALLNFDADYGHDSCNKNLSELPAEHAHCSLPGRTLQECEAIKSQLSISRHSRPAWDTALLEAIGYKNITIDTEISSRIYKCCNEFYNPTPMFLIRAEK
ncbi:MAG: class I SAM-dependent methyltransferase [Marvinbryantia sp.]|uniref:class I SAM-dependent methyltransferase n=1 Tax=Marvinbryantia sp. TaxID=2496532 RepID=UPI0026701C90|nr:class I SAM-dependent methyltransferase [uncultured Marvinbryantia sp.]